LDIPENFYEEIIKTTKKATEMLLKENSATGFNIIVNNGSPAGQIIHHAHLHILPRKENDGFRVNV
jgi:histidine triad (HIT) family protein